MLIVSANAVTPGARPLSERAKRSKTAAYLHGELTTRANGPGQQDGERQVH